MAKAEEKKSAAPEETGKDVALFGSSQVADLGGDIGSELEGLSGLGYSERAEDSLVPIVAILQDNSAEVKRQHSKHIPDSKSGDLIIRSLSKVIDPETTPVAVQWCGFEHVYIEWQGDPGEGVPVNRYPFDDMPEEAVSRPDPEDETRTILTMPNGNRLVDTREHYAHLNWGEGWFPVVIPMAGTNHTVSRSLTSTLKNLRLPNGQRAPAWFRIMRMGTKFNQRGSQSWFNFDVKDAGWCTDADLRQRGRELFESLQAQTINVETAGGAAAAAAQDSQPDVQDDDCPV